ncbi:polysaccharide biosynthesis tyrosine autokinase [uncultured Sphingomonas sp.]|uniref:GumC family protein n=1 Tax=uncultured Sphingomonas sp. TaxID=158754 RepID=UPI002620BF62|nr:polysaccharide biosynthesis tyrosine autokinase [uncultured Sphingomonas sp.]
MNLANDPVFFDLFGKRPAGSEDRAAGDKSPLPAASRADRVRQAGAILLQHLEIDPVRLSRLVTIRFTAPDKRLAAKVANAWASNFISSTLERRYDATSYARKFLEGRLGQLRLRLEDSERQLVGYAARERIINIPATGPGATGGERSIVADNLAALNTALNEAKADRVRAASRLSGGARGAVPEALQNSAIAGLRERRAEAAAEYQKMMVQFEPSYPQAKALKAKLDQLDASIAREESRVQATLRGQYDDSTRREEQLSTKVGDLENSLLQQRRRGIQYQIFQREADTNRQLYDALLQRYKEIGVASGVGVNNIAVVDPASEPVRPSSPRLLLNLLLSFIVGGALSASLVFLLEQTGDSFDDPEKVERELGVPLLGTIPLVAEGSPVDALQDRKSQLVEAYLSLEAGLSLTTDHGVPQVMSVTSTRPAEGKSLTALALATLLARSGRRTLLIDGDMRSPSVAPMLELSNEFGLSSYLAGNDDLAAMIVPMSSSLGVLPAGTTPPNAAELLSSDRFPAMLTRLRKEYDHLIIDSPPVMGLADSPLIGHRMDAVLLAVESHGIRAALVRRAFKRLIAARVRVIGVVLTKFRNDRAHLGYGYDYGYGYGHDDQRRPGKA